LFPELMIKCKWLGIKHHAWITKPFSFWQYRNESMITCFSSKRVNISTQPTVSIVTKYITFESWNLYFSDIV
jgi:hypothetical protein